MKTKAPLPIIMVSVIIALVVLPLSANAAITYTNTSLLTNPSFETAPQTGETARNWSAILMLQDVGAILTKTATRTRGGLPPATGGTFVMQIHTATNAGDDNIWSQPAASQNNSAFTSGYTKNATSFDISVFMDWSLRVNTTPASSTSDNGTYGVMVIEFNSTLFRMHYLVSLQEKAQISKINSTTNCYFYIQHTNITSPSGWFNFSRNVTNDAASCGVQAPWQILNITPSIIIITGAQAARDPHTRVDFDSLDLKVLSSTTTADPPPLYRENTTRINGFQYNPLHNHSFEVNWTKQANAIQNVSFETNITGTLLNYSFATTPRVVIANAATTTEMYYINFTDIAAGNYSYRWFANETGGSENFTDGGLIYQVLRNTSAQVTVNFNASSGFAYGNPLAAWANVTAGRGDTSAAVVIYRNGTEVTRGQGNNSYNATITASIHNFSAYYSESQNWTNTTSIDNNFVVNRATPILALAANNSFLYSGGTVLYASFDENASGIAYDSSGYGNDVTWTGSSNVTRNLTGRFGNALQFDGVDDFVGLSNTAIPTGATPEITIEGWVNARNKSALGCMVGIGQSVAANTHISVCLTGNLQEILIGHWGAADDFNSRIRVPLNTWNHIAYTLNSSNHDSVYLNGVLVNSSSTTVTVGSSPTVIIGSWDDKNGNNYYFNGTIDEVRIFNYSMTVDEINASAKGVWMDLPETYPNATNITGFVRLGDSSAAVNLTRNGTRVSNGTGNTVLNDTILLAAGIYQYNVTYWETQNYTAYNVSKILSVTRGNSNITVTFNTSSGFAYGDPLAVWANITARLGDSSGTVVILQNDTEISRAAGNTSANRTYAAGIYNFSAYYSESQNWTNATATNSYFTIQKATPILGVATNNSFQAASGTVLYLSFDENATQTARDQSGFGNDGTWTGANNVTHNMTGRFGNALSFDGLDDFGVVPNIASLNITKEITIEAWTRPVSNNTAIVHKPVAYGINTGLLNLGVGRGKYGFVVWSGSWNAVSSTTNVDYSWRHVAGRYNRTHMTIFVDGIEQNSTAFTGDILNSSNVLGVGAVLNGSSVDNVFNGSIDEVKIFNYSKSADE
ncbi:MAG: LamG domain-containing protein, partial [Candidatus Aenigmarchaeota archaeon]|nr:LamG domain-containing protein [Candidatus Aenigmarchaeota archaeon]